MSSGPGADEGGDRPDRLGDADRVLLLALSAWAPTGRAGRGRDGSSEGSTPTRDS